MARIKYPIFFSDPEPKEKNRQQILEAFNAFKEKHNRYPACKEIDLLSKENPNVPTVRNIQCYMRMRRFYEDLLGIPYVDARTGDTRAATARMANLIAMGDESTMYKKLEALFGESNVHHGALYPGQTNTKITADFKVYYEPKKFFLVDTFSANGIFNLNGCINIKLKKLQRCGVTNVAPIYFVSCHDAVNQFQIDTLMKAKKIPFPRTIKVLDIDTALVEFERLAKTKMV